MDGTLTPPRQHLDYKLFEILSEVCRKADIGIVSGSNYDYIIQQCGYLLDRTETKFNTHILPCNGTMHCTPPSYKDKKHVLVHSRDMKTEVGAANFTRLMKILIDYQNHIVSHYDIPLSGHFISYRGSMINWCPIGRNATNQERELFSNFDKSFGISSFRKTILEQLSEELENLRIPLTIKLGGETSFDIYPIGWDKTYSLSHFQGYEIFFIGDRCGENGNDKEIYDALQPHNSFWVKDTKDTKLVLETLLKEWKNER